jgi:hypothetical protein
MTGDIQRSGFSRDVGDVSLGAEMNQLLVRERSQVVACAFKRQTRQFINGIVRTACQLAHAVGQRPSCDQPCIRRRGPLDGPDVFEIEPDI